MEYAEASSLTGNLLILFNSQQISEQTLLAELQGLDASAPVVAPPQTVAVVPKDDPPPTEPVVYVTGFRRRLYLALGWASVGLAVVGAILPGIPTVPFVVLASYFFIRSSPRTHAWLRRSRWFGPLLRDWEEHRGVKRGVKNTALGLMAVGLVITLLVGLPLAVVAMIVALEIIGLVIILRLPVIEPAAPALASS